MTVTVVRGPGFDAYGDRLSGEPTRHEISGCALARSTLSEIDDRGREGVISSLTLYAPAGADLLATDQVEITSGPVAGLYELDGEPFEWTSPYTGWTPGLEVSLRRAEG